MPAKKLCRILLWFPLAIALLWVIGLFIYQPLSLIPAGILLPLALLLRRRRIPADVWLLLLVLVEIPLYLALPGPRHATWKSSWAKAPQCTIQGDILHIDHIRDFHYRSEHDFDIRYRSESYPLSQLESVDFAECHWDGMTAVCHTMLSFGFKDGRQLVVSAETRLPEGVEQNAIGGIYKQYGMLYLFGTEEDIFALRTNHRHEDLSLYPMRIKPESARRLLLHYVELARRTEEEQIPYNTITGNCSTGLVSGFRLLAPQMPRIYDLLPIHNGSIAGLLFRAGAFVTLPGETEQELRTRCYLGYDLAKDAPAQYSRAIRLKNRSRRP